MKYLMIFALVLYSSNFSSARILDRCDIARELMCQGFSRESIPTWVCIVEAESSGDTSVIGPPNDDGSIDYGLFQINSRYWCGDGFVGHGCNISCDQLLSDDIRVAVKCAKKIFGVHGYSAWAGWTQKCQGALPNVDDCGLDSENFTSRSRYM